MKSIKLLLFASCLVNLIACKSGNRELVKQLECKDSKEQNGDIGVRLVPLGRIFQLVSSDTLTISTQNRAGLAFLRMVAPKSCTGCSQVLLETDNNLKLTLNFFYKTGKADSDSLAHSDIAPLANRVIKVSEVFFEEPNNPKLKGYLYLKQ